MGMNILGAQASCRPSSQAAPLQAAGSTVDCLVCGSFMINAFKLPQTRQSTVHSPQGMPALPGGLLEDRRI